MHPMVWHWTLYMGISPLPIQNNGATFIDDFSIWRGTKHWATFRHHKATSKNSYRCFSIKNILLILLKSNRLVFDSVGDILGWEGLRMHKRLYKGTMIPFPACNKLEAACSKLVRALLFPMFRSRLFSCTALNVFNEFFLHLLSS